MFHRATQIAVAACVLTAWPVAADAGQASDIIDATGVQGGIIVHLGCGNGQLTNALRVNERYQVHGLDTDPVNVTAAREHIKDAGSYGPVAVDRLSGRKLPYVDNMVNLVVAENASGISQNEIMRVLAPRGVAYLKEGDAWKKTVKPVPENIDEWTHYLHDPSGNAVAHDDVVGPPRHLQWVGSPRWSRHHDRMASMSALVSTGGRLFYVMDEGSRVSIQLPPDWKLVGRDAFNGTVLWKRDIGSWQNHLWPLKSGPTQLARRLVAIDDRVFVTLGFVDPVSVLDAATGETVRTLPDTKGAEEIVVSNGTVLALVNDEASQLLGYHPKFNVGDQKRVFTEFVWNEQARKVVAVDADSGSTLWSAKTAVAPLTMAANDTHAFYYNGERVICRDLKGGDEVWASIAFEKRSAVPFNFGPKLVLYNDVLLFAGGDRKLHALDIATGKEHWNSEHERGGYQSPEDLLVSGGLIWSAPLTGGGDSGVFKGRDPKTGETKKEFAPDADTYWFHHRCYIAKATDNFLMPSRTGIEFVDPKSEHWDINHWVRGGCLYGVMPCNGLTYAPPHNCACYPEAKLYGMNALAPASATRRIPESISEQARLEKGPVFDQSVTVADSEQDWPTYRHDFGRTGLASTELPKQPGVNWTADLGGRLSSMVSAGDYVYVSQIDKHTVHALHADSGKPAWSLTTGGRVDSPPTIYKGRAIFGSADGYVYNVRASDGELIWRYRAAPVDRRLASFEQIESVWPVHGSVLVQDDVIFATAGRSNFLDQGIHLVRLDLESGTKLSETTIDETDPATGRNLQERIATLQMPVGLPDIMSCNGDNVFMRSQKFDLEGNRLEIGPNSGDFAGQASVHEGSDAHMFAPMGFLDDTWFHRAYWVYGRSFAGGHAGFYQAGRFAPSGRILVVDDENVYGYGRKPEYLKWTTPLEHWLFSAPREAPVVPDEAKKRRRGKIAPMVKVAKSESLNPANTAISVEAWAKADRPAGTIVAHGGDTNGYAIYIKQGKPQFSVRVEKEVTTISAKNKDKIDENWFHIAGVLTEAGDMSLYVNGKLIGTEKVAGLIPQDTHQGLEVGADDGNAVGNYISPHGFSGMIDEVHVYHTALTEDQIQQRFLNPRGGSLDGVKEVLSLAFEDDGDAHDSSGNGNDGTLDKAIPSDGRFGRAMAFISGNANPSKSFVAPNWHADIPVYARAMLLAPGSDGKVLYIAGPEDIMNEDETFDKIMAGEKSNVDPLLNRQDKVLDGDEGGILLAVSATDGKTVGTVKLDSLPAWDSMIAANGRLFMATTDGKIVGLGSEVEHSLAERKSQQAVEERTPSTAFFVKTGPSAQRHSGSCDRRSILRSAP